MQSARSLRWIAVAAFIELTVYRPRIFAEELLCPATLINKALAERKGFEALEMRYRNLKRQIALNPAEGDHFQLQGRVYEVVAIKPKSNGTLVLKSIDEPVSKFEMTKAKLAEAVSENRHALAETVPTMGNPRIEAFRQKEYLLEDQMIESKSILGRSPSLDHHRALAESIQKYLNHFGIECQIMQRENKYIVVIKNEMDIGFPLPLTGLASQMKKNYGGRLALDTSLSLEDARAKAYFELPTTTVAIPLTDSALSAGIASQDIGHEFVHATINLRVRLDEELLKLAELENANKPIEINWIKFKNLTGKYAIEDRGEVSGRVLLKNTKTGSRIDLSRDEFAARQLGIRAPSAGTLAARPYRQIFFSASADADLSILTSYQRGHASDEIEARLYELRARLQRASGKIENAKKIPSKAHDYLTLAHADVLRARKLQEKLAEFIRFERERLASPIFEVRRNANKVKIILNNNTSISMSAAQLPNSFKTDMLNEQATEVIAEYLAHLDELEAGPLKEAALETARLKDRLKL